MTSASLPEYRCECGKLLFKGVLFISAIEIKCRYCHRIRLLRDVNQALLGPSACAIIFDEQGSVVNFSERASQLLGYSDQELLRMNAFMLNTVITPTLYRKLWLERSGEPRSQASIFLRRKDGTMFGAGIMFKFVVVGDSRYFFGVIDASNQQVPDVDGSQSPPWIGGRDGEIYLELDVQGRCRPSVMRGYAQIGRTTTDLPGLSIVELCPRLRADIGGKTLDDLMTTHVPFEVLDNVFLHTNGTLLPVESYFVPSYEGGSFSGYWMCSWMRGSSDEGVPEVARLNQA